MLGLWKASSERKLSESAKEKVHIGFPFGLPKKVVHSDMRAKFEQNLLQRGSDGQPRNVVLVGHSMEQLGIDLSDDKKFGSVVAVIETLAVAQYLIRCGRMR